MAKKKIVFLNVVCNGSTGKIVKSIGSRIAKDNYDVYFFFGRGNPCKEIKSFKISNKLSVLLHVLLARLGFNGHGSYFTTKKLVKNLRKINPDIIHLHNIHGYYLNLKVLFKYLKNEYQGKIVWTLHDCWAFTGHCSHFVLVGCDKWQTGCYACPRLGIYPKEYIDTTKREYTFKKELFTNIHNLTLVAPSNWLKNIVEKSFLSEYPIKAIHNGIDLNIFKPTIDKDIYRKYDIPSDKKILLGVANVWEENKGFNIFLEMANILKEDEVIVLVGVNDNQKENLPKNVIGIKRTDSQIDLAKIYSMATVFINPSYEETFSLVTVEALACGLPVVVCGMSALKEIVDEYVGIVINKYTALEYYKAYQKILAKNISKKELKNYVQKFSDEQMIEKNIQIYEEV